MRISINYFKSRETIQYKTSHFCGNCTCPECYWCTVPLVDLWRRAAAWTGPRRPWTCKSGTGCRSWPDPWSGGRCEPTGRPWFRRKRSEIKEMRTLVSGNFLKMIPLDHQSQEKSVWLGYNCYGILRSVPASKSEWTSSNLRFCQKNKLFYKEILV
jgi:hypothetical protein